MDELIKFLASKIGYTLAIILGFIVPGVMFVFVWNRSLYMELDIIKLLLLSFGISFLLFIPMFIICTKIMMLGEKIGKLETNIIPVIFLPIVMNVLEMMLLITIKIINSEYTIQNFCKEFGVPTFWIIIFLSAIDSLIGKVKKCKKK